MAGAKAYPVSDVKELTCILKNIDLINPVVRYLLEFEARTGLRYVDVSKIKWSDVTINGVYRDSFTVVQSKSYNRRVTNALKKIKDEEKEKALPSIRANARSASAVEIKITDEIKEMLDDLKEFTGDRTMLFESTHHRAKKGNSITINYVNLVMKRVATDLGLPYQLSTHSMRKTFAQMLIEGDGEKKASMKVLMNALGQSSLSSTQHYIDTFRDDTHDYTGKISFSL